MEDETNGTTTAVTFRLEKSVLQHMKETANTISSATGFQFTHTDLLRFYATKCGSRFVLDVLKDIKDDTVHEDTGVMADIKELNEKLDRN
jgi:hypothetical protein